MPILFVVRDNKGNGSEPMSEGKAIAKMREMFKRNTGRDLLCEASRDGYSIWAYQIEVTDREFALYTS